MKDYVEKKFEVTITDEDMRKAVKLENEIRVAKKNLVDTMKNDPCPVSGQEVRSREPEVIKETPE